MQARLGYYKRQLKLLEGFHQRCLRQILHIKWQSHVSDTEVLGESRATKHPVDGNEKLSPMGWSHYAYGWRPSAKQLFYGEMGEGKRSTLKPNKRFKDTKYYQKQ